MWVHKYKIWAGNDYFKRVGMVAIVFEKCKKMKSVCLQKEMPPF